MTLNDTLSFRQLESEPVPMGDSALEKWYRAVRDIPLHQLPIGDLCRAVRQQLYVDAVTPIAIRHFIQDPLSGDKYDGELLVALKEVPAEYWRMHLDDARMMCVAMFNMSQCNTGELTADIEELATDIEELATKLRCSMFSGK